jgi:hypothetical protein
MKRAIPVLVVLFILFCGCTQPAPNVEVVPTPVTVVPTFLINTPIETVGPTPTQNYDICFDKNITTPDFCYDHYYWVRPTVAPVGMGYTARVWQNNSCVYRNKTSEECEGWGDDSWTVLFMKNLTIVKNLSSINNTELVSAVVFYNKSFDLNVINDDLTFSDFINKYWDKTYPTQPYDKSLFAPDPNVTIVPIDTFNPDGF